MELTFKTKISFEENKITHVIGNIENLNNWKVFGLIRTNLKYLSLVLLCHLHRQAGTQTSLLSSCLSVCPSHFVLHCLGRWDLCSLEHTCLQCQYFLLHTEVTADLSDSSLCKESLQGGQCGRSRGRIITWLICQNVSRANNFNCLWWFCSETWYTWP